MISVSFGKITELYDVLLVTINRHTSNDSGILCKDFGVIRTLPMDHTRFSVWVTILIHVVHLPGPKRAGSNYHIGPCGLCIAAIAGDDRGI